MSLRRVTRRNLINKIKPFYYRYQLTLTWLLAIVATLIITALTSCAQDYLSISSEIITGFFIISGAITAAIISIHQYHIEQRTSKLQKIYFEDALLSQAKVIENMMSQTKKNFLTMEYLISLAKIINAPTTLISPDIYRKPKLTHLFNQTYETMGIDTFTTNFKKETISKLFYDTKESNCALIPWLDEFERDTYRFTNLLRGQIFLLKNSLDRSRESDFIKNLSEANNHVQQNYLFIERHAILFTLFSELVLDFSGHHYTIQTQMLDFFKKEKAKAIINLINESYKELIKEFNGTFIGNFKKEKLNQLKEKTKTMQKKIRDAIYPS